MIMAIDMVTPIFHIITIMINTMPCPAGIMNIQSISINTAETMIIPLITDTTANVMMTIIEIILAGEIIINVLLTDKR